MKIAPVLSSLLLFSFAALGGLSPHGARAAEPEPIACDLERHATGWVVGECEEMRVLIQAGYAGRGKTSFLRSVALDRVGEATLGGLSIFSESASLQVAGRRLAVRRFVVRQPQQVASFGGLRPERDPAGVIRYRGLHTRLLTPKSRTVSVTCFTTESAYQAGRCEALIRQISRKGLPGGAIRNRGVKLLGQDLQLDPKCWSSGPRAVYCFLEGGMRWHEGSESEVRDTYRRRIQQVSRRGELGVDGGEMKSTIQERACQVLGLPATCTHVAHSGRAPSPLFFLDIALVRDGDRVMVLECPYSRGHEQPSPCRQVFGS